MYVFIEFTEKYDKILEEINIIGYIPIILYKLKINNKNQIKKDIDNLKNIKKNSLVEKSALQIIIEKIDNSTASIINSLKKEFDLIIGLGGLNKINRFFLEQTNIDFLQDPHNSFFKPKIDFIHHFNSGLNHILCKYAKESEIGFLYTLNFFDSKLLIQKELGRINQNIIFARKYEIPLYINFIIQKTQQIKSIEELRAIYSLFDISEQQKNESFTLIDKWVEKNLKNKSKNYISKNIELI